MEKKKTKIGVQVDHKVDHPFAGPPLHPDDHWTVNSHNNNNKYSFHMQLRI